MRLKDIISNKLSELDMSYYQLSKLSGVHPNTLYSIKNGRRQELTLKHTVKVFSVLGLDLNELNKIDWR